MVDVFMFHINGGFLYRSKGIPTLRRNGGPSQFQILQVNDENDVVEASTHFNTRADYIHELVSWKRVAIQCDNGKFLKCGNFVNLTKSAQVWYCDEVGLTSIFELENCLESGTFSFKSHNGLNLHYNTALGTIVFKGKESRQASWYIHPLGLAASDTEQILLLGVVNKKNEFILLRAQEGIDSNWNIDAAKILSNLFTSLKVQPGGSCSMFQHPLTLHQWCVTRSVEESLNIVVSTEKFPRMFAAGCVEELEEIYIQFQDKDKESRLRRNSIDKTDHFIKLLTALMYDYNDKYSFSSFAAIHDEIRNAMNLMADNIERMQQNVASTEELTRISAELLEIASKFEYHSSNLKLRMLRKSAILIGVIVGGTSGAAMGFFIGGPGGAAILGVEAAEVAAGLCVGMVLGSSIAVSYSSRFWKRRFVSFGKQISTSSHNS